MENKIIQKQAYNIMRLWNKGEIVKAIDLLTLGNVWGNNMPLFNEELKNAYEEEFGVQIRDVGK